MDLVVVVGALVVAGLQAHGNMKNNTNFFNSESVSILLEVLPYIRQFNGASIVVKLGGAAMENADLCKDFARDIALLQLVGIKPVVIHGGGPKITKLLDTLNIPTQFIDGIRVTDEASMEVVEMVLSGNINKEIVAQINSEGGRAVGISGRDASLANAHIYNNFSNNTNINEKEKSNMLGRVGSLNSSDIKGELIEVLEKNGYVPVIAPIANDKEGKAMNINADIMAGAIAGHLKAKKINFTYKYSGCNYR